VTYSIRRLHATHRGLEDELPCKDGRSDPEGPVDGGAIMMTWFKRFALLGGIVIVLELVAWVGIATLGPDAFRQMIAFYDPVPKAPEVVEQRGEDGSLKRCALYRGELLCIGDEAGGQKAETDTVASAAELVGVPAATEEHTAGPVARRCASFEGQTICIKEGT